MRLTLNAPINQSSQLTKENSLCQVHLHGYKFIVKHSLHPKHPGS